MSLQALYQQRQRERGDESKNLDAAWKQAGAAFTNAALGAHAHVTASCAPLKNNQAEVLAVTQVVRQQIQELDSCVTAWTGLLSEINQVFMELGDLEHYAAVIARQALVVESVVETIVDRRQHGHGHVRVTKQKGSKSRPLQLAT
ncbi:hypothetical protein BCR44DRAFT_1489446 [Catenaria anguillulae PL171]|uniref:Uncharacterized protein n=1 Tax=Catenaria anguillulae PL171 TaxID=765915 RepID=A0A1Y2H5H1_9FUNG|nr:hypothetical protein BCR44DRAFT_1489446 [Catenaria anguillulae PL171]